MSIYLFPGYYLHSTKRLHEVCQREGQRQPEPLIGYEQEENHDGCGYEEQQPVHAGAVVFRSCAHVVNFGQS